MALTPGVERSPTLAGWELALRLRARRTNSGTDVETITATLGFSRPYWSAIENARTLPSIEKLEALIKLLQFNATDGSELRALRELARQRAWWHEKVPERLQRFVGLEQGAVRKRTYEALVVTGLLQTADYVRSLASSSPFVKAVNVEAVVSLRLRRQERLTGPDPLQLTAIMSQSVLLQHVGPPQVLLDQLRHLLDTIERSADTIEIRIIPFERSPAGLLGSSTLYLLDFVSKHLPTVAWTEITNVGLLFDDPDEVHLLEVCYDQALEVALTREESLELIEATARELERKI